MRVITVQQPWAWAILRGGKDVENRANKRGQGAAKKQFNHVGPLLIHSSQRYAGAAAYDDVVELSTSDPGAPGLPGADPAWAFGSIIGTVDLVGIHTADECMASGRLCSPWAEPNAAHLQLANPRPMRSPYPYRGSLGLWSIDDPDVLSFIERGMSR